MELNQTRIEDAIVSEVADKMIGDEELYNRVKNAVDARINALFEKSADAQIRLAIETAIAKEFDHEYYRINSFGERKGELTTIRRELETMIAGYWNEKVDKSGKPSSGYGADITRAEWMMTRMVAADFKEEMKQHVINLGGALKDKLRGELHETVNKLLSETFHVNSFGDQESRRSDRSIIDPKQMKTQGEGEEVVSAAVYNIQKAMNILIKEFAMLGLDPPLAIVVTPHQMQTISMAAVRAQEVRWHTLVDANKIEGVPIEVRHV